MDPPNSMYASSTMTSASVRPASDATAATGCALPVGLFGEQTKTTSGLASTTADTRSSERAKPSSRVSDTISVCVSQAIREWSR